MPDIETNWRAQPMSQQCFLVWQRFDPEGLKKFAEQHGPLRVRVPVPRQVRPEPSIGGH